MKATVIHDRSLGYVYFVSDGDAIKIGWTKRVFCRLAQLQVPHLRPLELLGTIAGDRDEEARMHHRFHHLRIRGEWFRADPAITGYLKMLRSRNMIIDYDQHYEEYRVGRLRKIYQRDLERLAAR
jgi:hypothetical protein